MRDKLPTLALTFVWRDILLNGLRSGVLILLNGLRSGQTQRRQSVRPDPPPLSILVRVMILRITCTLSKLRVA